MTDAITGITRLDSHHIEVVVRRGARSVAYRCTLVESTPVRSFDCDRDMLADFTSEQIDLLRAVHDVIWRTFDGEDVPLPVDLG